MFLLIPTPPVSEAVVQRAAPATTERLAPTPSEEGADWRDLQDLERYLLEQMTARIDASIEKNRALMRESEAYLIGRIDDRFDVLRREISELRATLQPAGQTAVVTIPGGQAPGRDTTSSLAIRANEAIVPSLDAQTQRTLTPAPPPHLSLPIVERIERAMLETGVFLALSINFELGKEQLLPSSLPTLDAVGHVLTNYPDLQIEIAGHTDSTGPLALNQTLSQARAESVRSYLLATNPGIVPERLVARGYGPTRPLASNDRPTGRMLNRRVEFTVLNPEATQRLTRTTSLSPVDSSTTDSEVLRLLRELLEQELLRTEPARPDTLH
ncbi:MAG: OmpA family protein [Rhodothermales bacterium]|nr:OmpA family protein [Rhodothermales bacterium]